MPSAEVAVRLAKVLGVSVEYLVTGSTDEKPDTKSNNNAANLMKHFFQLSNRDQSLLVSFAESMAKMKTVP